MPSDRTLQTRRTLPKAGHGGTPCQKAHGEYHNGEALATPGKKKSNFAHPKLSNFAHSKSLTLRVGQQTANSPLRTRREFAILCAAFTELPHGVMVAPQILNLLVKVRVLMRQPFPLLLHVARFLMLTRIAGVPAPLSSPGLVLSLRTPLWPRGRTRRQLHGPPCPTR